jgi:hypothetical protein
VKACFCFCLDRERERVEKGFGKRARATDQVKYQGLATHAKRYLGQTKCLDMTTPLATQWELSRITAVKNGLMGDGVVLDTGRKCLFRLVWERQQTVFCL